jgi:thioredoxin-dependent peroxiredoxin
MAEATLRVGDMAPDFTTLTNTGETVKLADYRGKRVVLYFYPKGGNDSSSEASFCG